MTRRYWVISPNANNDGDIKYWINRSIDENRVFVGYDSEKKHGNTFENKIQNGDYIIIAHGARDDRNLYLCGIVDSSEKEWDEGDEIYYRGVKYLLNEEDFLNNDISIDSKNAWGNSSNPGTIYELKVTDEHDEIVINKLTEVLNLG